ncbi:hypothetical protein KKH23_07390, partial [Patescibacteria group bacterium]|nr:hypothetical protein [Patescibacteria group bacterium]
MKELEDKIQEALGTKKQYMVQLHVHERELDTPINILSLKVLATDFDDARKQAEEELQRSAYKYLKVKSIAGTHEMLCTIRAFESFGKVKKL